MVIERKSAEDWVISLRDVPEFYYLLGVYFGDGCIKYNSRSWRMVLYVCDLDFLERWLDCVEKIFNKRPALCNVRKAKENCKPVYGCDLIRTSFCLWVKELTRDKTEIPELVRNANKECKIQFLSGYFDSEGSIAQSGTGTYTACIQTISPFVYDIQKMFVEVGIEANEVYKVSRLTKAGNQVYDFTIKMKSLFDFPINIKRKKDRVEEYREKLNDRTKKYSATTTVCCGS